MSGHGLYLDLPVSAVDWQIIGMLDMAEPDSLLLGDVQPSSAPNCLRTAAELADHCLCFFCPWKRLRNPRNNEQFLRNSQGLSADSTQPCECPRGNL